MARPVLWNREQNEDFTEKRILKMKIIYAIFDNTKKKDLHIIVIPEGEENFKK